MSRPLGVPVFASSNRTSTRSFFPLRRARTLCESRPACRTRRQIRASRLQTINRRRDARPYSAALGPCIAIGAVPIAIAAAWFLSIWVTETIAIRPCRFRGLPPSLDSTATLAEPSGRPKDRMFWEAVDQVARELDQSGIHREVSGPRVRTCYGSVGNDLAVQCCRRRGPYPRSQNRGGKNPPPYIRKSFPTPPGKSRFPGG